MQGRAAVFFNLILNLFIFLFTTQNDHDRGDGYDHKRTAEAQNVPVQNHQRQNTDNIQSHGNGPHQLLFRIIPIIRFYGRLGSYSTGHTGSQNFIYISNAGNGQPVGGFRYFSRCHQIVIAIQGVLQNFLLGIFEISGTCKQQLYILNQLFSHSSPPNSRSLSIISFVSCHSAKSRKQASFPAGVMV